MYFTWNCRISGNPGSLFITFTESGRDIICRYYNKEPDGNPLWNRCRKRKSKQMTLQALEIIHSCDLIVLPAVTKEECYAYRIVEQVCPEISDMPLLCMPFPMIKDEKSWNLPIHVFIKR